MTARAVALTLRLVLNLEPICILATAGILVVVHSICRVNECVVALPSEIVLGGGSELHQAPGVHSYDPLWLPYHALQDDAVVKSALVTRQKLRSIPSMLGEVGGFARGRRQSELLSSD